MTPNRLMTTSNIADALNGADLVIEAAPEKIDLKLSLMADIDRSIAAIAGMSREHINRQLRSWEESGVISLEQGRVRVLDADMLEDISESEG